MGVHLHMGGTDPMSIFIYTWVVQTHVNFLLKQTFSISMYILNLVSLTVGGLRPMSIFILIINNIIIMYIILLI